MMIGNVSIEKMNLMFSASKLLKEKKLYTAGQINERASQGILRRLKVKQLNDSFPFHLGVTCSSF